MKLSAFQRRAILAGALVATVAAALMPDDPDTLPAPSAVAARSWRPANKAAAGSEGDGLPQLAVDKLAQTPSREAVRDAFEARSWAPPPAKPAPPPPPQAPPLPFTYVGKIMEGGQITVFLARQDRSYVVKRGETLDGTYRVDEINAASMQLTYLPLDQKQTLAIGAAN